MAGAKRSKGVSKKTTAAKKVASKKKTIAARKTVARKKAPAAKEVVAKKKAPAAKKVIAKKKAPAAKKVVAKKKAPAAKKAVAKKKRPSLGATQRREARWPIDDEAPTVEIAAPRTERSPRSRADSDAFERTSSTAPSARPSERVLAAVAEMPAERALTAEETEAMAKVAETARKVVDAAGEPSAIVVAIASFLEDVRLGKREEPKSQDVRLGLGVLWGEQLRTQVGWTWVHLTYPDGFASYALVPEDRAFACFPLNRVPDALRGNGTSTSAHVFESIREGALPTRRERTYLVIG